MIPACGAISAYALTGSWRVFLPSDISVIITGTPKITIKNRYAIKNGNPPFLPIRYGNFHKFPRPIAAPAVAMIKPSLLAHSFFCFIAVFSLFHSFIL